MKKILLPLMILFTSHAFACGGYDYWEDFSFYSLFKQTNISSEAYFPFLRERYSTFYGDDRFYSEEENEPTYPEGNITLWKELLPNWTNRDIKNAIYRTEKFDWADHKSKIEQRAKKYIGFAQECSDAFKYRMDADPWDYKEILENTVVDTKSLLAKANKLLNKERNTQLQARYYYQIIRTLHYEGSAEDAIRLYEHKIENKLPKTEIYYYIVDQVAGCYYDIQDYEKAAYLFIKVLNKSIDRKQSAFLSFRFCTRQNAEGKSYFQGVEDEKDLLLITSLRGFSDDISNLDKFISLDANDSRIELLYTRSLNNLEQSSWQKHLGTKDKKTLTPPQEQTKKLLTIAEQQATNPKVENKDFWLLASSYLSFINHDIKNAQKKLAQVNSFPIQKNKLAIIYKIFQWNTLTPDNEDFIAKVFRDNPIEGEDYYWNDANDFRHFIQDRIAHVYYLNDQLAKAYLVHNTLKKAMHIESIELLDAVELFYQKPNKSKYEKMLVNENRFLDHIHFLKGIYYLQQQNPAEALVQFNQSNGYKGELYITNTIFSNNITECFDCKVAMVMDDEVFKASAFEFIQPIFSRKELSEYLIQLQDMAQNDATWKGKLANYLLGNYYYNISNTGYYRGLLTDNNNLGDNIFVDYGHEHPKKAKEIIANRKGFSLFDISQYENYYFGFSKVAIPYFQKTIDLSTDRELNARCLYLIAKCELNDFYNNGGYKTYTASDGKYYKFDLPYLQSFKTLKDDYSDTYFHDLIIHECSYFRLYCDN